MRRLLIFTQCRRHHLCPHLQRLPQLYVNEERTALRRRHRAASRLSRAIVKSSTSDEPREPIAQHEPANLQGMRADCRRGARPQARRNWFGESGRRTRPRGGRRWPTASRRSSRVCSIATWKISSGYAGSTFPCPCASSGLAWLPSRRITPGSHSHRFRLHADRSGYRISAEPPSPQNPAAQETSTQSARRNTRFFDDISGCTSCMRPQTTGSMSTCASADRPALRPGPRRASRRSTWTAAAGKTRRHRRRRARTQLIYWDGNIQLLEHEQLTVAQPIFHRLSRTFGTSVLRRIELELRGAGLREELSYLLVPLPVLLRTRASSGAAFACTAAGHRFDDRWSWIVTSVVPRFRRLDARCASWT